MLWYKAWRESRFRFLLSVGVLMLLCVGSVYRARAGFPPTEQPNAEGQGNKPPETPTAIKARRLGPVSEPGPCSWPCWW